MSDMTDEWRKRIEDAIAEGDEIHLKIVFDQVFFEIDEAIQEDCVYPWED